MKFFTVTTQEEATKLISIMPDVIAVDTEYIKGDPRTTKLLSIIISNGEWTYAVDPVHLSILTPTLVSRKLIFLQDYNHCDTIILLKHGCDLRNTLCYNLIDMHHLINENLEHDLGSRVLMAYGDNYKAEFWAKYKNFEDAPFDEGLEYQYKDGIYTYRLGMEDIEKIDLNLYEHVRKTSLALLETELGGLCVDVDLMKQTKLEMKTKIDECLPKLRKEFDHACTLWELTKWEEEIEKRKTLKGKVGVARPTFSFTSDKQIGELLYGDNYLRLPVIEKTKKRNPSTSYETLKRLAESYPKIQSIVEYKDIKAVYGTFVEGMLDRVDGGRIYPHFNVSGTDTGRLSHSNPNMANLPTTGVIRNFFIPSPGHVIIGADYAQLEVVIEANLTEDKNLLRIINEGVSKHDITAEGLGIDRNTAKTLNFALQYGAGAHKVSKILGITQEEAETVFKRYWELYSGVRTLKEKTCKQIEETGQITNLFGRTRHFDPPKNEYDKARQERQAYNFLIQGVAGDACNRAYWQYHEHLKKRGGGRTLFSVHDEIVVEVEPHLTDMEKNVLEMTMESVSRYLNFKYPLISKSYGPFTYWQKT